MVVIYNKNADLDEENNFSIDSSIKKISDRINKAKEEKENEIRHSQLPNFNNFEEGTLMAEDPPPQPSKKKIYIYIYKYLNVETQKIDRIEFLDYKKWYETKGAIWNSTQNKNTYRYMFENYNDREATRKIIKKRNDLLLYKKILKEMNKIYTMVGNKVYESPDYISNFNDLYWQWIVDLNKLDPQKCEPLRRNLFIKEKNRKK